MTRFRAASTHLAISAVVGAILFALFWFGWYPSPLFKAVGGYELFLMLLAIDVILGPLLTLVVFKSGKKSLKFDLAFIGLVQAAALFFGVWTLLAGRPVYVAALGIRFDVIQASQVAQSDLDFARKSLPLWGPEWVGFKEAADPKERERILFSGVSGGYDYGQLPQYHAPFESMRNKLLANALPISALRAKNPTQDAEITAWLASHGCDDRSAVFQGLKARSQDMAVILDAKTAAVVGIAPFKPWD